MLVPVIVKPGSRKGPLVEAALSGGKAGTARELIVHVREKAHDGEANAAVVKLLADYYDVAKSCVILKNGGKSRKKIFEIVR